jgi:hypothetical protein
MLHAIVLAALIAPPVVITNSGSTNFAGYSVTVSRDGSARIENGGAITTKTLSPKLVTALYDDLATSGPLDTLPKGSCMKSMSFGTSTHLTFGGKTSPDLQCPGGALVRQLAGDVNAILNALDVRALSRHGMMRVPPSLVQPHVMPTMPPSPSASPQ